jgi:hypothetical protein
VSQTAVTCTSRLASSWTAAEPMAPVAPLTRTRCPARIFAFLMFARALWEPSVAGAACA